MAEYRTIKRNGKKQVIRMDDSSPKPNLARSSQPDRWIQASDNPKHKGYVKEYLFQLYGEDAFTERGTIKEEYLDRAIEHAKANHQITWEKRLVRARTLKNLRKDKQPGTEQAGQMDTAQGKYEFEGTMHNGEITELTIRPEGPPDNLIQH